MTSTAEDPAVDTDVLVVGAGPTGLMLANWLTRLGVDHLVVDGKGGPTRESRALVLHPRSLEIYAQLGMVEPVLERAAHAVDVVPGFEARPSRGRLPVGDLGRGLTAYPGLHVLEQSANEELLLDHLRRTGGPADDQDAVRWHTALRGIAQDADGVTVEVGPPQDAPDSASHTSSVRARYVVGCDGAGSAVRHGLGVAFSGTTSPDVFWLVDAAGVTGLTDGTVNVRPGVDRFLIGFPMGASGRHRLIGTVRGGEPTLESVRRGLSDTFGVTFSEAAWFATYRLHHRIADRFRVGRVFLAGDAAHVHSPVGGQGMNTGLQDAHNLAFALAEVLAGAARDSRLDHYESERRPVAKRLVATTDRAFDAVTDARPVAVALRRTLVPALPVVLPTLMPRLSVAPRLAAYIGQIRIHYWRSEAQRRLARGRRDRVVGRRLPWTGENHAVLAACEWQVHAYGATPPDRDGLPRPIGSVHAFEARADLGLDAGTLLLVRPDGFVAQRARSGDADVADVFAAALAEFGLRTDGPPLRSSRG